MKRKEKTIHYLYKTTCIVTKRYYIGIHSTNNINDGYLGSGKRLRYSIRKYGKENHIKEILNFFETRDLLVICEKEMVSSELINKPNCMNLVLGGGGFMLDDYHYECSKKGNKKFHEKLKNDELFKNSWINKKIISQKLAYNEGRREKKYFFNWIGKKHTEDTKQKIGEKNSLKQKGENNSQYGLIWITNGIENKKIKKESEVPQGWYKGRK